jgi:hypothetical protein
MENVIKIPDYFATIMLANVPVAATRKRISSKSFFKLLSRSSKPAQFSTQGNFYLTEVNSLELWVNHERTRVYGCCLDGVCNEDALGNELSQH